MFDLLEALTMSRPHIRVAIIGGGLAGATLANALINVPHLDLNLYESAPEFSERGAAVALGPYAQKALRQVLPSVKETLKRAGAVPKPHSRVMLVSSPCMVLSRVVCLISRHVYWQSTFPSFQSFHRVVFYVGVREPLFGDYVISGAGEPIFGGFLPRGRYLYLIELPSSLL